MNRFPWAVSAAMIVFCGWQVVSGIAQNNNAETPPDDTSLAAPELAAPSALPAMPAAARAPAAPAAAEDAGGAEAFPPAAQPAPSPAAPAKAGATEPAAPSPEQTFDIDRTPQVKSVFKTPVPAEPGQAGEMPFARPAKKKESEEETLANQEAARRQARDLEALKTLDLAYQAMGRADFEEAIKLFDQALSTMPVRPYTVETRNKARQAEAQCEYRLALKYYKDGKLNQAENTVGEALKLAPGHRDALKLNERIKAAIINQPPTQPPVGGVTPTPKKEPPVRFSKDYLEKKQRISEAIDRGRQWMRVKEYDKAAREFNAVLLEDKGNEEANANLRKIGEEGYDRETDQYERMKVEMMAKVRDTWTPAVKKERTQPAKKQEETTLISPEKQKILEKLNSIVIPQMEFRQANIVDVVKYLDSQSIVADKKSPPGEKGVNIILHLKGPAAAAPAPAPGPEGGEVIPAPEGGEGGAAGIPMVTLSLRNVVLLDAIKFITEVTGLKYRIEGNAVVITPKDMPVGEIITKTYRMQPNFGDLIGANAAAAAAAPAAAAIDVALVAPVAPAAGGDVKKFFIDAGVPFGEGTSIKYQPSLSLLIAANTVENLEKLEQILQKINVIPVQVEIEARFVEIGQNDLEELGIEWLLTDNWEIAQDASAGAAVPLSARQRLQVNKNDFTKGLRNLSDFTGTTAVGGTAGSLLSISSILTNPELSFILHLLEQRDGANLLSAPKVTTKSGANAEIKVVKEIIYPTAWEISGGSTGSGTATAAIQVPSDFQTRDTGVILSVTPVVGPDGYTIDLTMMPQVVELADWINYGSTIIDPLTGRPITLNNPQPIFHSRSITTSISIWDGQTVVMGGLITEQEATTLDKVPFLADIPGLGYLFQSKTTRSVKRNLLIFVTANLVDPAGNKINLKPVDPTDIDVVNITTTAPATP